jgi:mannose-6-phosphate isomerase-like protein (cupin superfamily)
MGMSEVPAGSESNPHEHAAHEECLFVYEGAGFVVMNGQEIPVRPGNLMVIQAEENHQLRASATERLRVVCSVAPAFKIEQFERVQDPKTSII